MTDNNDGCMNMAYEGSEAAEDTEAAGNWSQAWRKTFNMEAGDYIVMVSALVSNDMGYVSSHYRIQMNDSIDILPDTLISGIMVDGEYIPIMAILKVNVAVSGNQNFDFDLKRSGMGETAKIKEKRIACIRVCL